MKKQTLLFSLTVPLIVFTLSFYIFNKNFNNINGYLLFYGIWLGFTYILPTLLIVLVRKRKIYESQAWVPGIFLNSIFAVIFCYFTAAQIDTIAKSNAELTSGIALISSQFIILIIGIIFFILNLIFALVLKENDN